ncbi:MAG: response regulator [Armatimonadota bacterium]|nr:MAG: response regulator [Armatimonadota bacterium]
MMKTPRRVLVADSDYAFARRLRIELEARGHAVEIVSDGASAVNVVKARPFDGAVVDTDLAGADAIEVLHALSDLDRALPVVMTGRRNRPEVERQAREAGALGYVAKPCPAVRIIDVLLGGPDHDGEVRPRKRPPLALASLEPGQVLVIECPGGQVQGRLSSRVMVKHPTSLAATVPCREGRDVTLPFGTRVTVGFPMPDGWYQFETYVMGATSYRGHEAVLLAQPKLVSRVQRRRYARARATFNVELEKQRQVVAGKGQDACEGGIRVLTEGALQVGSHVLCHIHQGAEQGPIVLPGTVVWTEELRDNGHRYRTGIRFAAPARAQRDRLREWVERLSRSEDHGTGANGRFDLSSPLSS